MQTCIACGLPSCRTVLDAGLQPLGNRFLQPSDAVNGDEFKHPLVLAVCDSCGLVQLSAPPPPSEVRPRFAWISYNEPEGHVPAMTNIIAALPGLTPAAVIGGLTLYDDSTLAALRERGFASTWRLLPEGDLCISEANAGLETLQARWDADAALRVADRYTTPMVLVARRVLEHAQDVRQFLDACCTLLAPGAYAVFDVPDYGHALQKLDCSVLWEEHVSYFSPLTLCGTLHRCGFEIVQLERYRYALETSLVVIARRSESAQEVKIAPGEQTELLAEVTRAEAFGAALPTTRERWQRTLARWRETGPVALLGAGHLSCTFLNLLQLEKLVDFVVDDNPHKQGLFMPGSHLPILPSQALGERGVRLCLMSVSPENEARVAERNSAWVAQGGQLASIFPGSPMALELDA